MSPCAISKAATASRSSSCTARADCRRTIRFSNKLAEKYHVYAPLLPGYGDSEECGELRDMLDFTLHTWDVVEALGLKDPILVGHSMGGMIAAEMAAVAPHDVSRLALIAPGRPVARRPSDPRHLRHHAVSIIRQSLFHDVEEGDETLRPPGSRSTIPNF